ncbi:MAG: aldo/keto reductase [Deinococcales bacterium]|nr:aldo/keto reductase [Deinococcales bacterium]
MIFQEVQGVRVPALGFGTYRLTGEECVRSVADALALGYRHLDTAQSYDNEAEVGRGLRAAGVAREEVFLVSKVRPRHYAHGRAADSVRASLDALGTGYVDLMLLHWPAEEAAVAAALEDLAELQREGLVRHVGVSNFPSALVARAAQVTRLFCNQVEYHPFLAQRRLLAQAAELDLLVTAYRPLAKGLLGAEPLLRALGARYGKTPEQVALRWLVQQPRVATVPKSADPGRRAANLDVFDFALTPDEMAAVHGLAHGQRFVAPDDGPAWDE